MLHLPYRVAMLFYRDSFSLWQLDKWVDRFDLVCAAVNVAFVSKCFTPVHGIVWKFMVKVCETCCKSTNVCGMNVGMCAIRFGCSPFFLYFFFIAIILAVLLKSIYTWHICYVSDDWLSVWKNAGRFHKHFCTLNRSSTKSMHLYVYLSILHTNWLFSVNPHALKVCRT